MKYIPRHDFVIIQMEESPEESRGGIFLPRDVREDRIPGEVLAIGPGRMSEHGHLIEVTDLKVGDRVIFNKFSGLELNEEERLYMLRGNDIGCKLDDK